MSKRRTLAILLLVAGLAVGYVALSLLGATPVSAESPFLLHAVELVVPLLFVATGLVAARRPASRRTGSLVTIAALVLLSGGVAVRVNHALVFTAAMVLQGLFIALLAHAAVAYPTGRLHSGFDRVVVATAYVMILTPILFQDLVGCECPDNLLQLPLDAKTLDRAERVHGTVTLFAILAFVVAMVRHWRQATKPARRVLLPVFTTAMLLGIAHAGTILAWLGAPIGTADSWYMFVMAATAAVPIAYLGFRLRSRLAGSGVSRFVVELGDVPPPGRLRAALARALGDPTVEIAYWARDSECYVDAQGRPITVPPDDPGRAMTLLERGGERVGAVIHDPALNDDQALVEAACAAAGLALENERLQAEVRARLADVQASRARIVEAADAERRRVERNLHDGAQQRLVTLALALRMARGRLGRDAEPTVSAALLDEAADELQRALQELRELAGGLHPAILGEEGLEGALDSLAERAPLPVELHVRAPRRLPQPVEVGAYFLVSEALANAAKHSKASVVRVCAVQENGHLQIEVTDDGVGGATVRPRSGLEGLTDRVEALGGRLHLVSRPGQGTTLRAEIPCG